MKKKHYKSTCIHFENKNRIYITCATGLKFESVYERNKHYQTYCCGCFEECETYKTFKDKPEKKNVAPKQRILPHQEGFTNFIDYIVTM